MVARVASVAAKAGAAEVVVVAARAEVATVRARGAAQKAVAAPKVGVVDVVEGEDRLGAKAMVAEAAVVVATAVEAVLNHSWPSQRRAR